MGLSGGLGLLGGLGPYSRQRRTRQVGIRRRLFQYRTVGTLTLDLQMPKPAVLAVKDQGNHY